MHFHIKATSYVCRTIDTIDLRKSIISMVRHVQAQSAKKLHNIKMHL